MKRKQMPGIGNTNITVLSTVVISIFNSNHNETRGYNKYCPVRDNDLSNPHENKDMNLYHCGFIKIGNIFHLRGDTTLSGTSIF